LGEQFDQDPSMLFRLRGRTQAQILEALRGRRAESPGETEEIETETLPLSETLDQFWGSSQPLHLRTTIKPPVTELPILKRLGQPPFLNDDLIAALGPAYQVITQAALKTAFGDEPPATGADATD
jgi:uncharacterized Zn finger protein